MRSLRTLASVSLSAGLLGQTGIGVVPPDVVKPLLVASQELKPPSSFIGKRFGDLNGDGILDGVGTGYDGVYYALGFGQGDFGPMTRATTTSTGVPSDLVLRDIDSDGDLDILFVRYDPAGTHLFLNDGSGGFTDGTQAAFGVPAVLGIFMCAEIADLDNDGDLDIVFGTDGAALRLFVNDGQGRFNEESFRVPGIAQTTYDLELIDLDGDGYREIVAANGGDWRAEPNYVFFNDRQGRFLNALVLPGGSFGTWRVAVGDIEGDGDADLLFAQYGGSVVLLRNDGGLFTDVSSRLVPNSWQVTRGCALGDLDSDGDLDIVLGGQGSQGSFLTIHLNDGAGGFTRMGLERLWHLPRGPLFGIIHWTILADFDNDGDLDLLVVQGGGAVFASNDLYFGTRSHLLSVGVVPVGGSIPLYALGEPGAALLAFSAARVRTITPLGTLWLDPASLVFDPLPVVIPSHGIGTRSITIPSNPSLRGRTIQVQAVHATAAWTQLTNGTRITIQ